MGERREAAPGCKVFVGDLKPDTQEREVEEVFAKYGQLRNCFVARAPGTEGRQGGRDSLLIFCTYANKKRTFFLHESFFVPSGGFGFVEFEDARDASEAVKALDGTTINGSKIRTGSCC